MYLFFHCLHFFWCTALNVLEKEPGSEVPGPFAELTLHKLCFAFSVKQLPKHEFPFSFSFCSPPSFLSLKKKIKKIT